MTTTKKFEKFIKNQKVFHTLLKSQVEKLFRNIDVNLQPNTFLLSILIDENNDLPSVYLKLDDMIYNKEVFSNVKKLALELAKANESKQNFPGLCETTEERSKRIKNYSIKLAIETCLSSHSLSTTISSFCSQPVIINGYLVFTILQLNRDALESYYKLSNNVFNEIRRNSLSLIDAVISEILDACSKALEKPDINIDFFNLGVLDRDIKEIIRKAGQRLMRTPAAVAETFSLEYAFLKMKNQNNFDYELFDICNGISSLKYESADSIGTMIIAKLDHSKINYEFKLEEPILLNNLKTLRKLLEISDDNLSLICDSQRVYGLGNIDKSYNLCEENIFIVEFNKHYCWKLSHNGNSMMEVEYGLPNVPKKKIYKDNFKSDFKRIFKKRQEAFEHSIDTIWSLIKEAIKQKKGTLLIISSDAENEAKRLIKQCFKLSPKAITPNLLKKVTNIDGAVLIDEYATCYAIGAILDGIAKSDLWEPARGSRFNSAVRYVDSKREENGLRNYTCMAVVVSEDGYIDLIPNLMPQINRSIIINAISELDKINNSREKNIEKYHETISLLISYRFYLSQEQCNQINSIKEKMYDYFERSFEATMLIDNFKSDPEMNESYFLDEAMSVSLSLQG